MESAKEECCPPPSPKPFGVVAAVVGVGPATASGDQNQKPNPTASNQPARRTPFTDLNQVDADLSLARALQEQERAYMMLSRGGGGFGGSDYGSSNEDYEYDDEVYDEAEHPEEEGESDYGEEEVYGNGNGNEQLNPEDFENDEAYARVLQAAEGHGIVARLMALAGLSGLTVEHEDDVDTDAQDAWEDIDPDELSYEELTALGEVVGTESRGLSSDAIASLPSINYKADGTTDQCIICRSDYEDCESLVVLSCKHLYHPDCINKWLEINKVCPVCNKEVSTSENGHN